MNKPISRRKNTPYRGCAVLHMGDVPSTVGGISCSIVEGQGNVAQRVGVSPRDVPPTLLPIILLSTSVNTLQWPPSRQGFVKRPLRFQRVFAFGPLQPTR